MKRFGTYMVSDDGMISAVDPRSPDLNDADYQQAKAYADEMKGGPVETDMVTGRATRLPSSTVIPQPDLEQEPQLPPTSMNPMLVKYLRSKQANPAVDASKGRVNSLDAMNAARPMSAMSADPYAQTMTRIKNASDPYVNNGVQDEMHNSRRQALQASLMKTLAASAAQIGTMGGKQADTRAFGENMDEIGRAAEGRGAAAVSNWERGRNRDEKLADLYKTLREKKLKDTEWVSPGGKPIYYDEEGKFSEANVPAGSKPLQKSGSAAKRSGWQQVTRGTNGKSIWKNFDTGEMETFDAGYKPDKPGASGAKTAGMTPYQSWAAGRADGLDAMKAKKDRDAQIRMYQNMSQGTRDLQAATQEFEKAIGKEIGIDGFNMDMYDERNGTVNGKPVNLPGVSVPGVGRITAHSEAGRNIQARGQRILNVTIKDRSGAAVTNPEMERIKVEFAQGKFNTEREMIGALKTYKQLLERELRDKEAAFDPDVVSEYKDRRGALEPAAPAAGGWKSRAKKVQ